MRLMNDARSAVAVMVLAATAFWLPDTFLTAIYSPEHPSSMVTLACPLVLAVWYVVSMLRSRGANGPSRAVFGLIGVWFLGPLFMAIAAFVAHGGGNASRITKGISAALLSGFIPPFTLLYAAWDGSALALMIATAGLIICHVAFESGRWTIPPRSDRRDERFAKL